MLTRKERSIMPRVARDPFMLLRELTSDLDRMLAEPASPQSAWVPQIDVFEKNGRLVTKIDLPGLKKEDVTVEVSDRQLLISGERRTEAESTGDRFYRCEREYGSFYRAVPLPEGAKLEDVQATFADGVLEVSVPMPVKADAKPRMVEINDAPKAAKTAA